MKLLDVFCGVGGWTKGFHAEGWECTGVDIERFDYPGELIQADALTLSPGFVASFDAVTMSPPCEEFARAWLPWLRGDHCPAQSALDLLFFSIGLCVSARRVVECSKFAARHAPNARLCGSYALWGDIPELMPTLPATKEKKSGRHPELRAEIPLELSRWMARYYRRQLEEREKP
jgi:hypothetical protein